MLGTTTSALSTAASASVATLPLPSRRLNPSATCPALAIPTLSAAQVCASVFLGLSLFRPPHLPTPKRSATLAMRVVTPTRPACVFSAAQALAVRQPLFSRAQPSVPPTLTSVPKTVMNASAAMLCTSHLSRSRSQTARSPVPVILP